MDERRLRHLHSLKQLVEHPLYQELLGAMKSDIMTALFQTQPFDNERREKLYSDYHAVDRLEGKINAFIGELAMLEGEEKLHEDQD